MRRALELASSVSGKSAQPVGRLRIVAQGGETVGGLVHISTKTSRTAEVIALTAEKKARGGITFRRVEPHAHTYRTPPLHRCVDKCGIRRVVSGWRPGIRCVGQRFSSFERKRNRSESDGNFERWGAKLTKKIWRLASEKISPFVHSETGDVALTADFENRSVRSGFRERIGSVSGGFW